MVGKKLPNGRHSLALLVILISASGAFVDYHSTTTTHTKYEQLKSDHSNTIRADSKAQKSLQKQIDELKGQVQQQTKTEQDQKKQIDDLKAQVSAKQEAARIAAATPKVATRTGGMGGALSTAVYPIVGNSAGNGYDYGYCTWYVKNRRSDIPNNWGDAHSWYYNAQSIGWPTGTSPRPGAIGQSSGGSLGHVVYVESVNANGSVNISEMNYAGWNIISSRTVAPSAFVYIY